MKIPITESYKSGEHALTRAELERVLDAAPDHETMLLIKLAVSTGLRRGDIVRLEWSSIDWEAQRVTFYEQKKRRTRTVYLSDSMMSELSRWRKINASAYVFMGKSEPKYGKGHMSDRTAYDRLQYALRAAGLDNRPFHALRATCIKLCQEAGWSTVAAAKHVGDTVRVIERHYMAPSDGEMKSLAVERPIV